MAINLNPQDYEENSFENGLEEDVSGSLNVERTDYTDLDESYGDGDENGARGLPEDQSQNKKNQQNKIILGGVILLAVGLLVFSLLAKSKNHAEPKVEKAKIEEVDYSGVKKHEFSDIPPPRVDLGDFVNNASDTAASDTAASDVVITDNTQTVVVQAASEPSAPPVNLVLERRLGGSVLVNEGSLKENENESEKASVANGDFEQTSFNEENSEKSFNLSGSVFTPRTAQQRGDKTLLLTRGTTIPCVLVTKIVTDHAGITKCQATKDVWSANGKTVLIERGSVFLGEQTAAMLQGQARVAVRWTQVETPKGVVVQIDSPSVGKLGAAGNAAYVNYHFWKRFGGSVMISLIGDLSNGLGKRLSKRDADVTFEQSNENANQMAEEALRNSINIPPTGTINQGALLNIMVARDVDFKGVYERIELMNMDRQPEYNPSQPIILQ